MSPSSCCVPHATLTPFLPFPSLSFVMLYSRVVSTSMQVCNSGAKVFHDPNIYPFHVSPVQLWDVRRKGCIFTYKGHSEVINSIQFSPDGKWVVSASSDSTTKVRLLSVGLGDVLMTPLSRAHKNGVTRLRTLDTRHCISYLHYTLFMLQPFSFTPSQPFQKYCRNL